jgi:uncharacterized protein DUF3551
MRPLLLLLAGFALGFLLAAGCGGPAAAVEYPWCANFADGAGSNCGFTTYEQCMLTARGTGGYCAENTFYTPPATGVRSRPARHNRRPPDKK